MINLFKKIITKRTRRYYIAYESSSCRGYCYITINYPLTQEGMEEIIQMLKKDLKAKEVIILYMKELEL